MTERAVWYGHLTTRRRLLAQGGLLIAGGVAWLSLFLVLPSLVLVAVAFVQRNADGGLTWQFTLDSFRRVIGASASDNLRILVRSLLLALFTTSAAVALAYPMSFFMARGPRKRRFLWLAAIMVPLCTNLVIRTYAWKLLLSAQLPPARLAAWLGWIEQGRDLLPSWPAVSIGMVSAALPFAVVPLYSSVDRLDWSLVEAAQDLYASRARVFFMAIVPQTLPGLSVALLLTFVPAMSMFLVTDMLGGAKHWMVGNLIQHQFGPGRNISYGAALSFVLIAITLAGLYVHHRQGKTVELS